WFHELPEHERLRLRACWADARERDRRSRRWAPRKLERALAHGAIVSLVVGLVISVMGVGLADVLMLTVLGSLGAGLAQLSRGGRFAYAVVGTAVYFGVLGRQLYGSPFLLYGVILMAYGLGVLGMEEEMRQAGGFDVRHGPSPTPAAAKPTRSAEL
ncbi:MAG: hypothetical protein KDC98_21250, partial [Planctomycetes bacterium]|nr:hypothetical protein [Planctomycetota bacterium]